MDKPLIEILMATYNGERFIKAQIYSICRQTYANWRLLIHDDGSSDNTVGIIKEMQRSDARIQLIEDKKKQLGSAQNFLYLLSRSTAPYCMFSDQDDLWMEQKAETLLAAIRPVSSPAIAYANAYYYKDNHPVPKLVTEIHPTSLNNMLFMNGGIQGCSLILNRALIRQLETYPPVIAMHDHFITLAAATFGKIISVNIPLMYYRQHAQNVTGETELRTGTKFLNFIYKNRYVIDYRHFQAVRSFYDTYQQELSPRQQRLFSSYFKYAEHAALTERIYIVLSQGFHLGQKKGALLVKTLIRKPLSKLP
ncbi:rhamnosyltransferase [bacterium A37T11]|nr:rhamnosyltransferase [bacterium A37T11]